MRIGKKILLNTINVRVSENEGSLVVINNFLKRSDISNPTKETFTYKLTLFVAVEFSLIPSTEALLIEVYGKALKKAA